MPLSRQTSAVKPSEARPPAGFGRWVAQQIVERGCEESLLQGAWWGAVVCVPFEWKQFACTRTRRWRMEREVNSRVVRGRMVSRKRVFGELWANDDER